MQKGFTHLDLSIKRLHTKPSFRRKRRRNPLMQASKFTSMYPSFGHLHRSPVSTFRVNAVLKLSSSLIL
ncbi:hypothetical protein ES288_D11G232800v1 [Gossypium darwinii]|uniref:Uncharacterized protein n=1 Tax=Gossypium darwinii TaxID=34276 RepID=A0A5D2APX6_GOSDA|nr:hypothetical protein ES288_D11G232800v1 [Gossypium darwinii]